jgi:hypothetical protein
MDVAATNFKLIASHDGWQYTLHETGVSEPHIGNEAKIHVTVGAHHSGVGSDFS